MTPYYSHAGIQIFHGDCREILPTLGKFDLLLTDPPYGIGAAKNLRGNKQHGKAVAPSRDYGDANWDDQPASDADLFLARQAATQQVIFGGNYFTLPPSRAWLVWDKVNGDNGYADCELAWTNLEMAVRMFRWQWMGMLQEDMSRKEQRVHPTQKPLPLMKWCISLVPDAKTVLDPFCGSGTTLVAAKAMGLTAVGIELHEPYCEIAAKRLSQEVFDWGETA
jgi:DNA modification methylase